jgi:hypothetical protein
MRMRFFSATTFDVASATAEFRASDHVDAVAVDPFARFLRADVRLILVVGADDLDLLAEHRAAEVLDRHLRRDHRALAAQIGVEPRHVGQDADLDDVAGDLGRRRGFSLRGRVAGTAGERRRHENR